MSEIQIVRKVLDQLNHIILGKDKATKLALSCIFARGHLLIEDLPGMGKTTLSHALASSLGLSCGGCAGAFPNSSSADGF